MTDDKPRENIPATLDKLRIPIGDVHPRKHNPRRGNIDVIAESLERNGQYRPIVVNRATGEILAGNHTYAAARRLNWGHIAATFVDVDEDQAARIVLADNRTADLGTYDDDLLLDLLRGLDGDLTGTDNDSMILVGPTSFVSICEHHLLPFTGTAWVAYIPHDRVVGLSKLPRLIHHYAKRPQVQERLTGQITAALDTNLNTHGSACIIRATHACMSLRGVKATGAHMTTSSLTGAFRDDPATRAEFMALTSNAGGGG